MKTTHRPYSEETGDFHRLYRFFIEHHAYIRSHSSWCLVRFIDWKYCLTHTKLSIADFWGKNAHLWFDGIGDLAGFVLSEDGGNDFAILTTAGYRFLFEEMLQWVLENWGDRKPALSVEVTALQTVEIKALERAGFTRTKSFYTFACPTNQPGQRGSLEEGFTIVDMLTHPDYRAQRILRSDAFRGQPYLTEEELQQELTLDDYTRRNPLYHPQTDLCVMAPDGMFVSGCEALINPHNAEADIERVCTHSAYRKRGFARAVLLECLRRLGEMGFPKAYITGYSQGAIALYGSLSTQAGAESLVYEQMTG